jgi:hypothetical protein
MRRSFRAFARGASIPFLLKAARKAQKNIGRLGNASDKKSAEKIQRQKLDSARSQKQRGCPKARIGKNERRHRRPKARKKEVPLYRRAIIAMKEGFFTRPFWRSEKQPPIKRPKDEFYRRVWRVP